MAQLNDTGYRALTAGADIAQWLRVKQVAGVLQIAGDGATDGGVTLGVVTRFAKSGDQVSVALRSKQGTVKMVAAAAIAADAPVYGAAGGKIDDAVSGDPIGIAMEAASGDNSIIEVLTY